MRCSRPGVPGIAHGRASVSGSRAYGRKRRRRAARSRSRDRAVGSALDVRDQPRLGAVREVRVGEQVDGRAVLERDARRLDRDVEAVARRRRRRSPAPATRSCGRRAPSAGRPAPASSASPSTGRRAGCRGSAAAARARSRARPSRPSARRPARPRWRRRARRRRTRPSAAPTAAISSSAWNVRTPKFLCRASSSRIEDAGVIGYAPRKSGSPLCTARGDQPVRERRVAGDLPVRPGCQRARA